MKRVISTQKKLSILLLSLKYNYLTFLISVLVIKIWTFTLFLQNRIMTL